MCQNQSSAPSHCLYCVHSRGSGMLSVLACWENGRVNELWISLSCIPPILVSWYITTSECLAAKWMFCENTRASGTTVHLKVDILKWPKHLTIENLSGVQGRWRTWHLNHSNSIFLYFSSGDCTPREWTPGGRYSQNGSKSVDTLSDHTPNAHMQDFQRVKLC